MKTRTTPNYRRVLSFAAAVHIAIIAVLMMTVAVTPATARGTVSPSFVKFTRQPANTQVNEFIRSSAYNPSSAPVQVTVFDQFGNVATGFSGTILLSFKSNPGNGILSGTVEEPVSAGRADFPNIWITQSGFGYRLHAVACPGGCSFVRGGFIAPADSHKFDIVDVVKTCDAGSTCDSGEDVTDGDTRAHMQVSVGVTDDLLTFSVSPGALNCANYRETSSLVTFNVTGGYRTKTITIIVPRKQGRALSSYQVCYNSPNKFTDRNGSFVNTGLLPDCAPASNDPAPCVVSRDIEGNDVVIVFSAPLTDPKGRV